MGWAKDALGPFMPYDAEISAVRFDPAQDTKNKANPFLEPKGTLEEWVVGIGPARRRSAAYISMNMIVRRRFLSIEYERKARKAIIPQIPLKKSITFS